MTTNSSRPDHDGLASDLRAQARAYDPQPPAGLRRRIFSALAETSAAPAPARLPFVWRASLAAVAAVALFLAAHAWLRPHPAAHPTAKGSQPAPAIVPHTSLAIADPATLAQRYLDQPLESEVQSLLTGLARTRDTVARVLPAPTRRPTAATRGT